MTPWPSEIDTGTALAAHGVFGPRVEDSECEDLDEINHIIAENGSNSERNVTLRGDSIGDLDPLEFPYLGEAMAAGSGKMKGSASQLTGQQGWKVQDPSRTEPHPHAQPLNLAPELDDAADPSKTVVPNSEDGHSHDPGIDPPSARHRSKNRGPKKDQAATTSIRKKIGKSKRSLSSNTLRSV